MPHGPKFLKTRRIFRKALTRTACNSYKPIQDAESQRLLMHLIENPGNFINHLKRFSASVMVCIAYGQKVDNIVDSENLKNVDIVSLIHRRMKYMATLNV